MGGRPLHSGQWSFKIHRDCLCAWFCLDTFLGYPRITRRWFPWLLSPHGDLFQASRVLNLCNERITTRLNTCPQRCHSASAARTTVHSEWLVRPLCKWYRGLVQATSHLRVTGCRCQTCSVHHCRGGKGRSTWSSWSLTLWCENLVELTIDAKAKRLTYEAVLGPMDCCSMPLRCGTTRESFGASLGGPCG